MRDPLLSLLYLCCLWYFISSVEGRCQDLTTINRISETDPNGTIVFNISKEATWTISFDVKNHTGLNQIQLNQLKDRFFLLVQEPTFFYMELRQTLDLELLDQDFPDAEFNDIALNVKCGDPPTTYETNIHITAVNEFPPVFNDAPYGTMVPESMPVNTVVYDFSTRVSDRDIQNPTTFFYTVTKYLILDDEEVDGREYFEFPATTRGELKLKKALDYDTMERRHFVLNISVADGNAAGSKTAFTTLAINITDADDQKPYFDFPNCGKPCVAPPYEAFVALDYMGPLDIHPVPIKAKDDDTLGTTLLFSIQANNYSMFEIIPYNGVMRQTQSVRQSGLSNGEFRLILQVRKNLTADLSAIAILSVKVVERQPNGTDPVYPPEQGDSPTKSSSSLLIPVIILGVLIALLIASIVVVFLLMKRKQKQMMVAPEQDKSEPQTEEEEIQDTDRSQEYNNMADVNEKLMFGKTTRAVETDRYPVPSGRAGQLPPLPLRDSATETTEVRKKKRSRKRNRNKEPEIFDGTREYNMGLDPEFFDSTDKSKIKRSQRSKKGDSILPISVPNDQPQDTDHDSVVHM